VTRTAAPKPAAAGALKPLAAFLTDFARYAGRDGVYAGALLGVGAVVDSLGLALLIPVLAVMAPATGGGGGLRRLAERLFALVGAHSPLAELAALLAVYAALMIVRAVVVVSRDVKLAKLQIGFLEAQRAEVARLLAGARWDQLARLRHARITTLMGGDLQRVSAGVAVLLQSVVSAAMLSAQCVLLIVLSPALAAIALALLLVIGLTLAPMMQRSRSLGSFVTAANLTLVDTVAQFLGGLKLAVSQNLQAGFTREFQATLAALSERQIAGVRQRSYARLAISLLSAGVGGAVVFIGFGVLHVPTAVLITLLLVIARMGGPVGQIQQGLQQIAFALPAYEQAAGLKRELAAVAEATPEPLALEPFPAGVPASGRGGRGARIARRPWPRPDLAPGRLPRRRRSVGGRQNDLRRPAGGSPRPADGSHQRRWAAARGRDVTGVARRCRLRLAGPVPVPRQRAPQPGLGQSTGQRGGDVGRPGLRRRRGAGARPRRRPRRRGRRAWNPGLRR
jgi:ABC-type multidrug transport system fused ATPase/permease subunit